MSVTVSRRTPFVLPSDPLLRFAAMSPMLGTRITLSSGDFEIEGILEVVLRPTISDDNGPLVVINTGTKRVVGPVLAGDVLS